MSQSEMGLWLTAGFIVILLILSAFLSGSDTALTATSRARMLRLQQEGSRRAGWVAYLLDQQERLLGAILLGNNLVNILASVLATSVFLRLFGETGVVYATLMMTVLVVVFAEVLPKTYAIQTPDQTALRAAGLLRILVGVLAPFTKLLQLISRTICALPDLPVPAPAACCPRMKNCAAPSTCTIKKAVCASAIATCWAAFLIWATPMSTR